MPESKDLDGRRRDDFFPARRLVPTGDDADHFMAAFQNFLQGRHGKFGRARIEYLHAFLPSLTDRFDVRRLIDV